MWVVKQEDKEKDTIVAVSNIPKPELGEGHICGEKKVYILCYKYCKCE